MTPRQAQLMLLSFAIFAAGVAGNALILQRKPTAPAAAAAADKAPARSQAERGRKVGEAVSQGQSPARESQGRGQLSGQFQAQARAPDGGKEEIQLRIARFAHEPTSIEAPMPEISEDAADSTTISAIQRELKQRNYGPLPVDGVLRPATRAAIMAFEHDRGLPLTGEAGAETLKRILLGAPAGTPPASAGPNAGKVGSVQAQEILRGVQRSLVGLGYQPGAIDGRFGDDTSKAIREFEMDKGLVPKGRVSAELLARLNEAAASAKR